MGGDEEAEEAGVARRAYEHYLRLWGSGAQQFIANTAAIPVFRTSPTTALRGHVGDVRGAVRLVGVVERPRAGRRWGAPAAIRVAACGEGWRIGATSARASPIAIAPVGIVVVVVAAAASDGAGRREG